MLDHIKQTDPETFDNILREVLRQEFGLEMIPSENYVSPAVLEAAGTVLTNKYAEGYPHKRYYGGCEYIDKVEELAIERAKKLFNAKFANVQPYSGSPANMAALFALTDWGRQGKKIMGMALDQGGHLTHGHKVNFSGILFDVSSYKVDPKTHYLDYDAIEELAKKEKPHVIIAGATAYPREIDFKRFREIADSVGAYLLSDISHIAGLIVAGVHQDAVQYSDVTTTTTHKTLRGPRGAIILTNNEELAQKINKIVFPGMQGGPHEHLIAAKSVAFAEALKPEFKEYGKQIVRNAKALATSLIENGGTLITGGTDNHLILMDVTKNGTIGAEAEKALGEAGITVNKNTIPYDTRSPFSPSGIRLGTPALTTRGMKEKEMEQIGVWIMEIIKNPKNDDLKKKIEGEIVELCKKFPLYPELSDLAQKDFRTSF